ncbi:Protein of unknown function (DUF2723) [Candidatus Kryptonium thompsonii]|uniref:glycosyltransferase family 117 protein n=3 Tax=Candidatus Kryptonium thompsonii TaxID=1633631 RepID=UPI00063ECDB4|nr:DUF2723 domain-containing protein [Candidatus Kryptonium thompsoni]CUS81791.1 Protein of unknown function (DUF2723) [Candidatus Kryptonium thompsoni]CUS84256.1 Protein of unknown function (DUF2723) [Candidatus Kryptonium thompsoni]CUT05815.1 Protein of unknown function (DUF2723) [Candidatus Kryptonium thompsoni]
MSKYKINYIIAFVLFLVSFVVYALTVQPSVPFWDCGEFIAVSYSLGVPHPPGAPFFIILGRIATLLPIAENIAKRVNLISAFVSALTVMFLYLITVRLILRWKPEPRTLVDKLAVYGAPIVGALTLAFSDTFWFNAVEAEVYATSLFLMSFAIWLGMVWFEKADKIESDRLILLIAYVIGLSIGVHLLSILTIFTLALIVYFRFRERIDLKSFTIMGVIAVGIFFLIYKVIIFWIPSMLDDMPAVPLIIAIAVSYGIYYAYQHRKRILFTFLMGVFLVFLGYTTYALIIIRANDRPAINENAPDNLVAFVKYLEREQYGEQPSPFKRRWSQEPTHQENYQKYSSDWDFFIRYQLNHMYLRYFLWNFVGRAGDIQDAPVAFIKAESGWGKASEFPNKYFALPLLVGLFGLYYHYRKDWKMFLSYLALFIVTGLGLAVYLNMPEPQPRERDYVFVGSFFAFAIWVGIGVSGLIELVAEAIKTEIRKVYAIAVLGVSIFVVPFNMLVQNWDDHDRSGNYVPWDYSYNLLQSCEKDAILFTNGDNDTFPLWYLQVVEGVRRDVRVVNLSLLNTDWYILQLKHEEPYGAKKVPISLSDNIIRRLGLVQWEPRDVSIPVSREVYEKFGIKDTSIINQGKITFRMPNTIQFGEIKAIRVQDIMVRDIIETNKWERPIYFAVTVSPDNFIGLDEYLRMEGLAYRVVPFKNPKGSPTFIHEDIMRQCLFNEPEGFYREPRYGFKFRNLDNPNVHFFETDRNLMQNYRNAFLKLAIYYYENNRDTSKVVEVLDRMESKIPNDVLPMDYRLRYDVARLYEIVGARDKFMKIAKEIEPIALEQINRDPMNIYGEYNPYVILVNLYEMMGEYQKAIDILNRVLVYYPQQYQHLIKDRIARLQAKINENKR